MTLTLHLAGIPLTLHEARLAAQWRGSDPEDGLLFGFVRETDADAVIVPATFPVIGGRRLSSLLPGGTGNCNPVSDKDTLDGVSGWWFYFRFDARRVPWTGP